LFFFIQAKIRWCIEYHVVQGHKTLSGIKKGFFKAII